MPAYKDKKTKKWYVSFYYDAGNIKKKKLKRGFATKSEALNWERDFLGNNATGINITFGNFVNMYLHDVKPRLKENSYITKNAIITKNILPYFNNMSLMQITPKDVITWQNLLMKEGEGGKKYSPTYLNTVHNQLSAIFNYAVRFYDLPQNPASRAGAMGQTSGEEVPFWTKEEYLSFSQAISDKPRSYIAFEILYWCGVRMGELLALTAEDINIKNNLLNINKSYQRIAGRDVVTSPKTKKSNRIIKIPDFLCQEISDYINKEEIGEKERLFPVTKSFLHYEMNRGCALSGVKKIKIHALRHSHISHLIDLGFSAVAIADRVGHESINITYRYAHLFPSKQTDMINVLQKEKFNEK